MIDGQGRPALDRATVEFALELAPDRCPQPHETDREIWMATGARRLAVKLEAILKTQEENRIVPT